MSRSDQEQREREARRARRLAERAEQRALRKAEQARRAASRAEKLAERARRRPRRDRGDSFEDKVDAFAERWERKAEAWFEGVAEDEDYAGASPGEERSRARHRARERDEARREARRRRRSARRRVHRGRTFGSRWRRDRGLYRDKDDGKVLGVCAGLADYLDVETWHVRLVAILGLFFVPSVAVPVYFITYFLMDDKPYYLRMTEGYDDDAEDATVTGREEETAASDNAALNNAEAFRVAKEKFSNLEDRLRSMEEHVTSSRFELQREFRKISGDEA